jgi:hypothetical protein
MFPEENKLNEKVRLGWVMEDLREDASVKAFLPYGFIEPFQEELEGFLIQARTFWHSVQYGSQRLEPNFQYSHDVNITWHELELSMVGGMDTQPGPPATADGIEDEPFVIFPWVYLMGSEPKLIIAGTVLRRVQFYAAVQEAHRTAASNLFSQPALNGQRNRPSRSMLNSNDGTRGGRTKERKPVTSTYV